MVMLVLCWLFGFMAMQSPGLPAEFRRDFGQGEPVITEGFVGVEWICHGEPGHEEFAPSEWFEYGDSSKWGDPEFCYAGLLWGPWGEGPNLVTGP